MRTSSANCRPDQCRIFENVSDLPRVGIEEARLCTASKPRSKPLQSLESQGVTQSRSNARIDPVDVLVGGEEQQGPSVV